MKLIIFTILFSVTTMGKDLSPVGIWLVGDKGAKVEIYENGEWLEGKLVWLKEPFEKDGSPKKDNKNPDDKLKTRSILNLVFLKDFKKVKDEEKWDSGTLYDAKSGKTYKGWIKLDGETKMKLRGYVGISLFGRTDEWTRDSL